jgi:hypothetical protein
MDRKIYTKSGNSSSSSAGISTPAFRLLPCLSCKPHRILSKNLIPTNGIAKAKNLNGLSALTVKRKGYGGEVLLTLRVLKKFVNQRGFLIVTVCHLLFLESY